MLYKIIVDLATKCNYNTIYISMCGVINLGAKKKKIKNKSVTQKVQVAKKTDVLFPQYITWVIAVGIAVLSFVVCSLAKYPMLFGGIFSVVNGALGLLAAEYLRSRDVLSRRMDIFGQRRTWVALSGLLAAMSVLLMYISAGMYPFGELTVVSGDMMSEYIPFALLRNKAVLLGDSLMYSEALGLGGNFWSVLVYNVSSPLMLFALFVDADNMDMFMFILQIIKVGAAGATFAYFYTEKFDRRDASVAVFSIAYALMSFSIGNMLNIIWMDCIMMLPLIILGAERVMQKKSAVLYSVFGMGDCYILLYRIHDLHIFGAVLHCICGDTYSKVQPRPTGKGCFEIWRNISDWRGNCGGGDNTVSVCDILSSYARS